MLIGAASVLALIGANMTTPSNPLIQSRNFVLFMLARRDMLFFSG
jgi:hypothetical protein